MQSYGKSLELDRDNVYYWVTLGPIPGYPSWHEQSKPCSYPFPTEKAAKLFAENHAAAWPGREVSWTSADGTIWDLTRTEESV